MCVQVQKVDIPLPPPPGGRYIASCSETPYIYVSFIRAVSVEVKFNDKLYDVCIKFNVAKI